MPRGPVVYSPPAGTVPQLPLTTILSATFNSFVNDVTNTFNTAQPIEYGGTGVTSLSAAKTAFSMITVIRVQGFGASGTYTPHPNMLWCIMEAVGGGGGGGGCAGSAGLAVQGGGGGGGGYSRRISNKSTVGASRVITIGAAGVGASAGFNNGTTGGITSVSGLLVANGGIFGEASSSGFVGGPALGGTTGAGDLNFPGYRGSAGFVGPSTLITYTAKGADSVWGSGGVPRFNNTGSSAQSFGAGGGGGFASNITANYGGGDGSAGLVFITEYCSE